MKSLNINHESLANLRDSLDSALKDAAMATTDNQRVTLTLKVDLEKGTPKEDTPPLLHDEELIGVISYKVDVKAMNEIQNIKSSMEGGIVGQGSDGDIYMRSSDFQMSVFDEEYDA